MECTWDTVRLGGNLYLGGVSPSLRTHKGADTSLCIPSQLEHFLQAGTDQAMNEVACSGTVQCSVLWQRPFTDDSCWCSCLL